ncbi:M48 family metalloprotease [Moraxella lacunata]|nr:M48 family metalloprotease [Moraxella lacunata]
MPQRIYQNFFELQRHYKRNSMVLYALFVMAMMIHVLLALLFFMIIWYVIFGDLGGFAWFWVLILVPSYFIMSVLYHYNKISHDNDFLLKDIDVTRLFINISGVDLPINHFNDDEDNNKKKKRQQVIYAKDIKDFEPKYRRYYEFAEQLAIASNIILPKLYVMDETGVNAFVAGVNQTNMMLVVSKGALELDNESLYGLIGHEYGHILHGDAKLNVQMYVLMSGLSWLYDVADGLEWLSKWRQKPKAKRYQYQDDKGERQEYVIVMGTGRLSIEFISLVIRLLGFLGMASSEWIKQHFNRQREFLADATSVQLTRSDGVAKLLQTLQRTPYLAHTQKRYTTHLSYFFFLNPQDAQTSINWRERMGHMGSTHPSNHERILALDEQYYDDFAKMAIDDLDVDVLQQTHDKMMLINWHKKSGVSDYKTVEFVLCDDKDIGKDKDAHLFVSPGDDKKTIDIAIYNNDIEISKDKVINGRLVVDKSWQAQGEMIYPKQARADYELKNIHHVNMTHVKSMTLPLIIARYLRNDDLHRPTSKLFSLFYVIVFCHDNDGFYLSDSLDLANIFYVKSDGDNIIKIDKPLLKTVAEMDRRIDNGLLMLIYQRIIKDLEHDDKRALLKNDVHHLLDFINALHHQDNHHDDLSLLWQGVHLYRLLSIFADDMDIADKPLLQKLTFMYHKYDMDMNDWIMITVMIYMVMAHYDDGDDIKCRASIQRLIRLINHEIVIDETDMTQLMQVMSAFSVMDMALWLLKYQQKNTLTAKRYIDTLHTALLGDGILCERDYEILLTLHQYWCPDDEFVLY